MKRRDGITEPLWMDGVELPRFEELSNELDVNVDVCIVGAGIAGLTTAYLLVSEGHSVVVLDEGEVGDGQTGRTSAHLGTRLMIASLKSNAFTEKTVHAWHMKVTLPPSIPSNGFRATRRSPASLSD